MNCGRAAFGAEKVELDLKKCENITILDELLDGNRNCRVLVEERVEQIRAGHAAVLQQESGQQSDGLVDVRC